MLGGHGGPSPTWMRKAGAEVVQLAVRVQLLASEEPVVVAGAGLRADGAEHVVGVGVHDVALVVCEVAHGAQAVVEEVRLIALAISEAGCEGSGEEAAVGRTQSPSPCLIIDSTIRMASDFISSETLMEEPSRVCHVRMAMNDRSACRQFTPMVG